MEKNGHKSRQGHAVFIFMGSFTSLSSLWRDNGDDQESREKETARISNETQEKKNGEGEKWKERDKKGGENTELRQ